MPMLQAVQGERMGRSILHVDINNFYASVEVRDNPTLAGLPVAVCGDAEARHGIILAKNYKAKEFGVQTAEAIWQAKRKCPELKLVPCHFEKYEKVTAESRNLLLTYSDRVEPFGMDEAWVDISPYAPTAEAAEEIADEIRAHYKNDLGLTASVGVSFNKIFAKLGSDMKKPDATTVITPGNFKSKIWRLPVEDLLFVGRKTQRKLNLRGVHTIGDLANVNEELVRAWLGKWGSDLRFCANGLDRTPVVPMGSEAAVKSIGNSFTPPGDLHNEREAHALIHALSESVATRMRRNGVLASVVVLALRDSDLFSFERQTRLSRPTNIALEIRDAALVLLRENWNFIRPLRSLGVRGTGLVSEQTPVQLSLFDDDGARERRLAAERAVDTVREKYGKTSILAGRVFAQKTAAKAFDMNYAPRAMR
ncbi:MAG: DNA polymerase IV [Clostridia bacterium]|nr:DNA polymerase IV [Clostridia bacterium]